jgi:hypothetical protein
MQLQQVSIQIQLTAIDKLQLLIPKLNHSFHYSLNLFSIIPKQSDKQAKSKIF